MIKELEINDKYIEENWDDEKAREKVKEYLERFSDFEKYPVYDAMCDAFIECFKGFENIDKKLKHVSYGYALTPESIEKFIESQGYATNEEHEYLITAHLLSMDNEKFYKFGTFIDLDGRDTREDFWFLDNCDELKKQATVNGYWIAFSVYALPKQMNCE